MTLNEMGYFLNVQFCDTFFAFLAPPCKQQCSSRRGSASGESPTSNDFGDESGCDSESFFPELQCYMPNFFRGKVNKYAPKFPYILKGGLCARGEGIV